MKLKFDVTGMTCAACSARVEKVTKAVPGVTKVEVTLLAGKMQVEADSDVTDINVGDKALWSRVRHFERREFRCPCGRCGGFPVEPSERIVLAADDMREAFGSPVIIVPEDGHSGGSGVRCQEYNDSLKGSVPNSKHVDGDAVDFSAPGKSASVIEGYLTEAQRKGKIHYWYKVADGSYHMEV